MGNIANKTAAVILRFKDIMPKDVIGKQLIEGLEKEFTKEIKKHPDITDAELLKDMREAPKFQELLTYLDMSMTNMEVMVKKCREKAGG